MNSKKQRSTPKQAAVLDAAAELFIQHGYDGASTEMIAEKAGVSRQTIYNNFASKEALFLAIATDLVEELTAPLAEAVEHGEKLRQTLVAFGQRLLDTLLSPKTISLYRLVITEVPRFPELGRAVYEAGPVKTQTGVAAYLSGQSQLRISDPLLAAEHLIALIAHPLDFRKQVGIEVDADSPEIARHIDAAVDTFLRAYRRRADEG